MVSQKNPRSPSHVQSDPILEGGFTLVVNHSKKIREESCTPVTYIEGCGEGGSQAGSVSEKNLQKEKKSEKTPKKEKKDQKNPQKEKKVKKLPKQKKKVRMLVGPVVSLLVSENTRRGRGVMSPLPVNSLLQWTCHTP